jgi:hypothetical protein
VLMSIANRTFLLSFISLCPVSGPLHIFVFLCWVEMSEIIAKLAKLLIAGSGAFAIGYSKHFAI